MLVALDPLFLTLSWDLCVRNPQSTGVTVNDAVPTAFNAFKLQREPHNGRFFVYKIENDEIVIESYGDRSKNYDDFSAALPKDECR